MGASSQKKLHIHLVDEKAMDDEILTMVVELKLVHGMVGGVQGKVDFAHAKLAAAIDQCGHHGLAHPAGAVLLLDGECALGVVTPGDGE